MKSKNQLFIVFTLAIFYSCSRENKNEFYLPAEWEYQSGVIINGFDDAATFEMAIQLSKESKIYCFAVDSAKATIENKLKEAGITLDSVQFLSSPKDFSYAQRDGFLFMKNGKGEKQMVNFAWNLYGWYLVPGFKNYIEEDRNNRELFNSVLSKAFPFPIRSSSMVNEGGAIETNGKGTILQVESVNMQRNPKMTKEAQEVELKRVLNVKKIIWLKEGAAEDPDGWGTYITENYFGIGVKGHLDEFCRFVNESTILISFPDSAEAAVDPVKKITLERMKVNYEILKNATDQNGEPFTIIKMPVPEINYMTFALDSNNNNSEIKNLSSWILKVHKNFNMGDTVHFVPASSYLNFLITNKTVFESKYWSEGKSEISKAKDEKARQILQKYFPDKTIYQINTTETNHNGGGLHCWSMQVPQ